MACMTERELVVVRTFSNKFEADVAKSALDGAGIESMVRTDASGNVQPGMWMSNGVDLIVRAEDAAAARDIIETAASVASDPE